MDVVVEAKSQGVVPSVYDLAGTFFAISGGTTVLDLGLIGKFGFKMGRGIGGAISSTGIDSSLFSFILGRRITIGNRSDHSEPCLFLPTPTSP